MSRRTAKQQIMGGVRVDRGAAKQRREAGHRSELAGGERFVSVDLYDPNGHRLVRLKRYYFDDPKTGARPSEHEMLLSGKRGTITRDGRFWRVGDGVEMATEDDDAGDWLTLWFRCEHCRASLNPEHSRMQASAVRDELSKLVEAARLDDIPRHARMATEAVGP